MVQWAFLSIAVGKAKRRGKVCCFRRKRRVSSPAMRSGSMFQEHKFMLHPKSIPFLPVLTINHPISGHFRLPIDLSWLADHQQWPGSEDKPGFYTPKHVIGAHWDCISWKWSVCGVVWWVYVCACMRVRKRKRSKVNVTKRAVQCDAYSTINTHTAWGQTEGRQVSKTNSTALHWMCSCAMYTASCTSILNIHNHFSSTHIPAKQFTLHHQSINPKRKRNN